MGSQGERIHGSAPLSGRKTLTFIAALSYGSIVAPCVFDHGMDKVTFSTWVKKSLAPNLNRKSIVVLDNLSSHTCTMVKEVFRELKIHYIYLPPYSPDMNPIEYFFSKLKACMRIAQAREIEAIMECLKKVMEDTPPEECQNYFRHCGYVST